VCERLSQKHISPRSHFLIRLAIFSAIFDLWTYYRLGLQLYYACIIVKKIKVEEGFWPWGLADANTLCG
jgi:hypothetical protein